VTTPAAARACPFLEALVRFGAPVDGALGTADEPEPAGPDRGTG